MEQNHADNNLLSLGDSPFAGSHAFWIVLLYIGYCRASLLYFLGVTSCCDKFQ